MIVQRKEKMSKRICALLVGMMFFKLAYACIYSLDHRFPFFSIFLFNNNFAKLHFNIKLSIFNKISSNYTYILEFF